ncbi:MAG: ABC transporter permease, partial [Pyrobaculum sp.]
VPFLSLETVYALTALWLASAGIGFTLSGFIKHMRYAWALPQILSAVFTIGAPVYYPADLLPSPYLAVLLPTGAAAVVVQHFTGLRAYDLELVAVAALALALQSLVGLYFLFKLARWRQP